MDFTTGLPVDVKVSKGMAVKRRDREEESIIAMPRCSGCNERTIIQATCVLCTSPVCAECWLRTCTSRLGSDKHTRHRDLAECRRCMNARINNTEQRLDRIHKLLESIKQQQDQLGSNKTQVGN